MRQNDNYTLTMLSSNEKAVNFLMNGMLTLALIGVPLSISKSQYTGWLSTYTFQCIGLVVIGLLCIFSKKLSYDYKVIAVILLALGVSIGDLLVLGLLGNGIVWAIFVILLTWQFYELKQTIFIIGFLLIIFSFSFYQFSLLEKMPIDDLGVYFSHPYTWGAAFFGSAMFVILIGAISQNQKRNLQLLLSELEQKNQEIEFLANHDALTGLPTLRLTIDRLEIAMNIAKRNKTKAVLLFLDLDGFKAINDTKGHDIGDHVLQCVSKQMNDVMRSIDTVCRVGGDEFIIIMPDLVNISSVSAVCQRLIDAIGMPIICGSDKLNVGVSIGYAVFPDHALDGSSLRKKADDAMYEVKKSGKNNYRMA